MLYIANTSKQVQEVNYWVGGNRKHFTTKIQPGRQESVHPSGTRDDHGHIVDQLQPYGLVSVSEIDRAKEFIGLCYQFDKPIPAERLAPVFSHNDNVLTESSKQNRQEAALAMDERLSKTAQETGVQFHGLEVDIEEQEQKGVDTRVNETLIVENARRGRGRGRKS
jgi:hypothetical protein